MKIQDKNQYVVDDIDFTDDINSFDKQIRKFDSSFVGRIDLIPTSNNDPGISGIITPSAKLDTDSFTFKNDD